MPQPAQNSLIHVLLLWTTILSIIQAVFIILFFTTGDRVVSQNSSTIAAERTVQSQANNTTSLPPTDQGLLLGKGQMLTYKLIGGTSEVTFQAKNPTNDLISANGKQLEIKKQGYYLLNLQVTLERSQCEHNGSRESNPTVKLKCNSKVILQGEINSNTCSTGLLGKVEVLADGSILELECNLPKYGIDDREFLTHFDIIFMLKP
uniref:uncharacterized protein LOC124073940 n=1 Tax=Scatophagus argus TaxID=75038 RepID=UPI001ED7E33B|nr:uncharacterized protein LOC124073940 [Scatophagus argus]